MDQNTYEEKLMKRRFDLSMKLLKYNLLVEDTEYYSIQELKEEVESLESQLKYYQEQSGKISKSPDMLT